MTTYSYAIGIDIGQINDPTAVVVLQFETLTRELVYQLVHAQRFPLGTNYLDVVERLATRIGAPPMQGHTTVAIDATGVGKPIVDLIRPKLPRNARLHAIWITGGINVGHENGKTTVPKRDLITTTQLLLQNERLRIAPDSIDAEALIQELVNYRVTITDAGNDTYSPWRERDHDDLVLALAIAAWTAENHPYRPARTFVSRGEIPVLSSRTLAAMNATRFTG